MIAALFFSRSPPAPIFAAPVDQEIRLENETVADTTPQSEPTEGTATNLPGPTDRVDGPARVATAEPRSVPTETAVIEAPPTSSGSFTFYVPPTSSAIGLTGTNRFLAPGALPEPAPQGSNGTSHTLGERPVEAKSIAESQLAVNSALGESVADRSKKGLGPEGPVLRALEGATTGSLAPVRGTATFLAVVDGNGFVTNVKIVDSSGDAAGWEDARKMAVAALKGKKLPGKFAKTESGAAELRITVSSDAVLPSGTRPDGSPVGVAGSSMTFDVADLSGRVRRVVHARLTGIREM